MCGWLCGWVGGCVCVGVHVSVCALCKAAVGTHF